MISPMFQSPGTPSGRVLDPIERVSEVIFGVLMAMTFIGSLSVASGGREEVRTAMIAALGCNIAWGLADAVMYLVAVLTERTRERTVLREQGRGAEAQSPRLTGHDWKGALGVFILVAASTFPLVVPFLVFDRLAPALIASRGVALAMLFLGGWLLARYSGGGRWLAGFGMAAAGAVLLAAIIALGG
jgi:VIT1/CCC1 family predicted Fe2+/Mn2+ transporter